MKFYITNNINCCEPDILASSIYVHVKAKVDGSQTAIISEDEIIDDNLIEKTQEEMQAILDAWIDSENENPFFDEINNNYVIQSKINLGAYLV